MSTTDPSPTNAVFMCTPLLRVCTYVRMSVCLCVLCDHVLVHAGSTGGDWEVVCVGYQF